MKQTTSWQAPPDHPAYAGHFPGEPIVPGVLLLDAVLQAITNGSIARRSEVRALKFLSPVRPGEALRIEHEREAGGAVRFEITAPDRKVATGVIVVDTVE
jgi:3-hydroxymyristoyl/3-hydroxydecanoyl-(acyl carrier protein) dehydratase